MIAFRDRNLGRRNYTSRRKVVIMKTIVVAAVIASGFAGATAATAQSPRLEGLGSGWVLYPAPPGRSSQQQDQYEYRRSGTRGRMGLGAEPSHPEGPGNVVTPHGR